MILFILDGYNVIHKIPELQFSSPGGLRRSREALIDYLAARRARWSEAYEMLVVFDAQKGPVDQLRRLSVKGIDIHYTDPGMEADDLIIEEVRLKHQKQKITVVSDDNRIGNNIRAYKAKLLKVAQFVNLLNPVKFNGNPTTGKGSHKINSIDGGDITTELEKLWK